MIRTTFTDLDFVELKYYPFMVCLDIFSRSYNSGKYLSIKICIPTKTKDLNIKAFHMTTKRNEAITLVWHVSSDSKCKFNSAIYNSNQKWNEKTCQCAIHAEKVIVGIAGYVFARTASM